MSTARAIQVSIIQVLAGILIGSSIEGVLPKASSGASPSIVVLETLVQAGMNGALIVLTAPYLAQDDPTGGIPFSMGLLESQPEFSRRIGMLSGIVKGQVLRGVQKTEGLIPEL